jgi:hypothetical protein
MLDDFVASARAGLIGGDKDFHQTRTPLVLDAEGLQEALELHERTRLEMMAIESRSAARLVESGEEGVSVTSLQACFKVPSPGAR